MRQGIASFVICTLLLTACATAPKPKAANGKPTNIKEWISQQSRTKKSVIAGVVAGGLLGLVHATLTGADPDAVVRETIGGAIAGGIAGFSIGRHQDRIFAGRDLAVRKRGYTNAQGYIAEVEAISFDPPNPKPGQAVSLYVRYVVLGPDPNEPLKIQMFRGLKYGEDYIFGAGPNEFTIPKGGGIVESTMEVKLPKKAPEGTYSVEALLEDSAGRFPQAKGTSPLYIVASAQKRGGAVTAAR